MNKTHSQLCRLSTAISPTLTRCQVSPRKESYRSRSRHRAGGHLARPQAPTPPAFPLPCLLVQSPQLSVHQAFPAITSWNLAEGSQVASRLLCREGNGDPGCNLAHDLHQGYTQIGTHVPATSCSGEASWTSSANTEPSQPPASPKAGPLLRQISHLRSLLHLPSKPASQATDT